MECNWDSLPSWLTISLLLLLLPLLLSWTNSRSRAAKQRPPGPPGWPVFGNMFNLGSIPHQNLYKLRFQYGPVLWLQLGSVNTMVIQSTKAATEFFKNHDSVFCDRKVGDAFTAWNYHQGSLAVGKYGAYWRVLRRLCTMELQVNKRITETTALRRKCIDNMIRWIEEGSMASRANGGSGAVEITRFLFIMSFNVVGNVVLSKDLLEPESEKGYEFFDATSKVMEWAGRPNLADFWPFLKWLDPLRIKRNMAKDMGRALKIVDEFVRERIQQKQSWTKKVNNNYKDFLDAVLEYEGNGKDGPDKISERNVTIIVLEMFFAGSETTSSTLEWAIVELLRNPGAMSRVKEELDRVVGISRKVEESDIDRLPYLQAVLKETLRLHPPAPLLLPRNAMEDSNYMGYFIPKNTQVFVNVWAIGRDQESWDDPLSFKPERFLGRDINYKGQHFELIPFGSGRRICVGLSLSDRVIHLALAALLQSFDWELDSSIVPENIDMNERMGLSVRKLVPLKVIPTKRNFLQKVM